MSTALFVAACLMCIIFIQGSPVPGQEGRAKRDLEIDLPENMQSLRAGLDNIIRPYEVYMHKPLLDVPLSVSRGLFQDFFELLVEVQTSCKEIYLADYLTGLLEFDFKFDHNIVYFIKDIIATDPESDVIPLLYAIKLGVYQPLNIAITSLSADYGISPASTLFKDLALFTFTPSNVISWTLEDALEQVASMTIQWHAENTNAICSGHINTGVMTSLRYVLEEAEPKMDRCLVMDVVTSVVRDSGNTISNENLLTLSQIIKDMLVDKKNFLSDIIYSSQHFKMVSYRVFQFFDTVLTDSLDKARVARDWQFIDGFVDEESYNVLYANVLETADDDSSRFQKLLLSYLNNLWASNLDTSVLSSILQNSLNEVL